MEQIIFEKQSEIFERIVRALDGRFFRVRFVVVERGGILRGRIISCSPLNFPSFPRRGMKGVVVNRKRGIFCLPAQQFHHAVKDKGLRIKSVSPSPYFNKFQFLTVIKIRAPSLRAQTYAD